MWEAEVNRVCESHTALLPSTGKMPDTENRPMDTGRGEEGEGEMYVVSTDILLSLIDKSFVHKVKVIPTTDGDFLGYDIEEVLLQRQSLYNEEIRLVWVATAVGLDYIQPIIPSLDDAAKALKELTGKKLTLHVVCNKPLKEETSCLEIVNVHWDREIAKKEITSSHIGLMPLPDTDFTRGKGGFKLIQYMSTAMPVIASAVGFNNDERGDYLMYKNRKYVVCDPTYINAGVGRTMPGMNNQEAQVIALK